MVADAGYGDATEFLLGLTERGPTHVPAVSPAATAHPAEAVPTAAAWIGNGRPPAWMVGLVTVRCRSAR